MKFKTKQVIDCDEWDDLVKETYGRPYCFQQQNGCQGRGSFSFEIPCLYNNDSYLPDSVPEIINGDEMGVNFKSWLVRDPEQKLSNPDDQEDYCLEMWWERNFYPCVYAVANDLYEKGLLEAGEYLINIDW